MLHFKNSSTHSMVLLLMQKTSKIVNTFLFWFVFIFYFYFRLKFKIHLQDVSLSDDHVISEGINNFHKHRIY